MSQVYRGHLSPSPQRYMATEWQWRLFKISVLNNILSLTSCEIFHFWGIIVACLEMMQAMVELMEGRFSKRTVLSDPSHSPFNTPSSFLFLPHPLYHFTSEIFGEGQRKWPDGVGENFLEDDNSWHSFFFFFLRR